MSEDASVNTGAVRWPDPDSAYLAVRRMQTKLHRWATGDPGRRFGDLYNLVYDPAFLMAAWERVATNKGAAGIDRATAATIETGMGVVAFLGQLRDALKSGEFAPVEVRQVMIPKGRDSGKLRRLGIPTIADRVVQASLKLVLEPIFEADCAPRGAALPDAVRDRVGLLSQQGPGSWRQPDPGGAGEGGSSLDNVAGARYCQTRRSR